MPTYTLVPHPDRPPRHVSNITVSVERLGSRLTLRYHVDGDDRVKWPAPASPNRADKLWQTTCFELFLRFDDDERYVEFNFSPSTRWAAYAFDGYRDGMSALTCDVPPRIERQGDSLAVECDLNGLAHADLRMGLAAVVEETDGTKSYWSLAHAPGAPDFHHPACFTARLPAPEHP